MKKHEVGFSIRGSITVPSNNKEVAKERLLNGDITDTYELFEALADNIAAIGNEAITITDVYEVSESTDDFETVDNLWVTYRQNGVLKRILITGSGEHQEILHEHFQELWGDDTVCESTGYHYYSKLNPHNSVEVDKIDFITNFEAEILRKYL